MIGKPAAGRKRLNILSDLSQKGKYMALERRAMKTRLTKIEESWKSYTCIRLHSRLLKEQEKDTRLVASFPRQPG